MNNKQLTELFQKIGEKDVQYKRARLIVLQNASQGNFWLIGGFLYRTLVKALYGGTDYAKDFDFIVENPNPCLSLPSGWTLSENRFRNPKFISDESEIDFVPLKEVYAIKKRSLPHSLDSFLCGTPLNIHSLAYEVRTHEIFGDIGISSLEQKIIRVNDMGMAEDFAKLYNTTVEEIISRKADELGFRPEYPKPL